jgi:hypothetical protein
MCVDCVPASLRIAQADPGRRSPPRGGSITPNLLAMKSRDPKPHLKPGNLFEDWNTIYHT